MFVTFLLSLCISTSADSSLPMSFMPPCMRRTHRGVTTFKYCT